jgi:prepilin-type N-terminal cleavage/methylation domain-containing protein
MACNYQPTLERSLHSVQRRGMTLVEVSVAVAISTLLLGIAVTLLVRLQGWDARFRDDSVATRQVAQLAELIRGDVRSATNVAVESPKLLTVSLQGDRDVRYELLPSGCLRIVEHPVGKEEQRELFRVGRELTWNVESSQTGIYPNDVITLELAVDEGTRVAKVLFVVSSNRGADLPPVALLEATK